MATTVKMYSGNNFVNVWHKRLADQNVAHFYTACIELLYYLRYNTEQLSITMFSEP